MPLVARFNLAPARLSATGFGDTRADRLPIDRSAGVGTSTMIRRCTSTDVPVIEAIINQAAEAYRGIIPADCWHEPYMSRSQLESEIAAGVGFWSWDESGAPVAVMGLQQVRDVTLLRHAYVSPAYQGRGLGSTLLTALTGTVTGPLLVGTWADATWAIRFYERHGFHLVSPEEKDRLLDTYWSIPARQRDTSVVLTGSHDRIAKGEGRAAG